MDYIVHGGAKSQTRLSDFHFSLEVTTANFAQKANGPLTFSPCVYQWQVLGDPFS